MTLMHTIVYRSRYHRAPVAVLTTFKAKRLDRVEDSFNKIQVQKTDAPVASVRQPSQNLLCHSEQSEESHKFKHLHI